MSNFAEHEHLNSTQSIAQTCAKKSRRTPALDTEHDDRVYRLSDLVLFNGDHEAALLYAQLRYWSGISKTKGRPRATIEIKGKGAGWIAKSAEMLWDELMLTEDQVRRINAVFRAGHAVEVETAMYRRSKCTHYRLTTATAALPENPESHSGKNPNHTPGKPHVFTETLTETVSEKEKTDSVAASPATQSPSVAFSEQTGKDEPQAPTPETLPGLPAGKRPAKVVKLWDRAVREFHPESAVTLTRTQCKMLRDIRAKLYAEGLDTDVAIRFMVERWHGWLYGVHGGSGMKLTPDTLSSYLPTALAYFRTKYISPEQQAAAAAAKAASLAKYEAEAAAKKAAAATKPAKPNKWLEAAATPAKTLPHLSGYGPTPAPDEAAPAPAQLVHSLPADEYDDCQEPPEYVKPDQFDQTKAEQARLKAAALKSKPKQPKAVPNMWQKGAKAAAA